MKKTIAILCSFLLLFFFAFPIRANEVDTMPINGYHPVNTQRDTPYYIDRFGNITSEVPSDDFYVEVLYDSRWDNNLLASSTASQYINIHGIILRGRAGGSYSNSQYNCRMDVGLYVYFNSSTLNITSVGSPTVIYFYCPTSSSGRSAPWATSYASGGRAYVTGYVTYYYYTTETLSGTASWGF